MKKYNIIYIDPPYKFYNWTDKKHGAAASHYSGLADIEIQNLPMGSITDDNCAMLLWMPSVKIVEGKHVDFFESWGFRPVSIAFVWRKKYVSGKPYTGLGFWTRNDCEFCMLGLKGKIKRQSTKVLQTIEAPMIRPHSSKPTIVRDKIVELFGDLPRIELFSRNKNKFENGWVHAGFEVDQQDIKDALQQIIEDKYL